MENTSPELEFSLLFLAVISTSEKGTAKAELSCTPTWQHSGLWGTGYKSLVLSKACDICIFSEETTFKWGRHGHMT